MMIIFEISGPFQGRPHVFRGEFTKLRVCWLWFAVTVHQVSYDQFMRLVGEGVVRVAFRPGNRLLYGKEGKKL